MKKDSVVTVIVLICALGLQTLSIVSQTKTQSNYKAFDAATASSYDSSSITYYQQTNRATFLFVYAAAAISCAFYLYLIVTKIVEKCPSLLLEWLMFMSVVFLQFGIATVLAVTLKNNEREYNTNMKTLDLYQSYDITGEAVDLLVAYKDNRQLSEAAMIVSYVVCFGAVLLVSLWNFWSGNEMGGVSTREGERVEKEGTIDKV